MGILAQIENAAKNRNQGNGRAPFANMSRQDGERETPEVWLNVGITVGDKFINLPIGLPVDTMKGVAVRGQNEEWSQLQSARNDLMTQLQQLGDQLGAGDELALPMLEIRIRKAKEAREIDPANNPLAVNLLSMLSANVGAQQAAE